MFVLFAASPTAPCIGVLGIVARSRTPVLAAKAIRSAHCCDWFCVRDRPVDRLVGLVGRDPKRPHRRE